MWLKIRIASNIPENKFFLIYANVHRHWKNLFMKPDKCNKCFNNYVRQMKRLVKYLWNHIEKLFKLFIIQTINLQLVRHILNESLSKAKKKKSLRYNKWNWNIIKDLKHNLKVQINSKCSHNSRNRGKK